MAIDPVEKEALIVEILARIPPAPTPIPPWWMDAKQLAVVLGAIGALLGIFFTGLQSWNNGTKIEKNHVENTAKLEEVKSAAQEIPKKLDSMASPKVAPSK